jgi:GNAT superfamily N-acetyltransferase
MHIERFAPAADAELVRACYAIYLSGVSADDPCVPPMSPRGFAGWLALGWTEDPVEAWLARDGVGEICGWYALNLPGRENRQLAAVHPVVSAAHRRAGVGTALVRHAAGRARRSGRATLSADTRGGSPGSAFAHALGARQGIAEIRGVLQVDSLLAGRLPGLRDRARSAAHGYSLLSWEGPVPGDQLAAVVAVHAAEADIPLADGHEMQQWDAERVRLDERRIAAQGLRFYTVAAQSLATGELAGLTQLGVDPATPTWGVQELTAVARPHRGHRLGLLVKVAMLELLAEREPQLTQIITGNADENLHMIAINVELGFVESDRWLSWEIDVEHALAQPGLRAVGTSGPGRHRP